ncbi:MAG: ExbD/TolR family protein [Stenotrophobium sp.]
MRSPRKVRRIERQHTQGSRDVPINIVSMIDVFAILVFYLMVSIAAVEMRPNQKTLQLPQSSSINRPPPIATQLMITRKDILVDNRLIMSVDDADRANGESLSALESEFEKNVNLMRLPDNSGVTRGEINILADQNTPYSLLKKVMKSCADQRFARISLAVIQRKPGEPLP